MPAVSIADKAYYSQFVELLYQKTLSEELVWVRTELGNRDYYFKATQGDYELALIYWTDGVWTWQTERAYCLHTNYIDDGKRSLVGTLEKKNLTDAGYAKLRSLCEHLLSNNIILKQVITTMSKALQK